MISGGSDTSYRKQSVVGRRMFILSAAKLGIWDAVNPVNDEPSPTKLVDVVTVADEDHAGNKLLQISKLRFGQKTKLCLPLSVTD